MNNSKPKGRMPMGGPMGPMGNVGEKPKNFKATIKKLSSYLKTYRVAIIIVMIFAFASAAFAIIGPKMLGKATTKLFEGIMAKVMRVPGAAVDFDYIGNILLLLLGLYFISSLFAFIQGFIMAKVTQNVSFKLRKSIAEKINKLPLKYFDHVSHGDVISRVSNDVDTVSNTLNQTLSSTITSITTIIGVLVMMISINLTMTLATLIVIPISMGLVIFIVGKSQKYFVQQQSSLGKINGLVEEIYGGHMVVKAFNQEPSAVKDFEKLDDKLNESAWKSQFLSGMMMPVMSFIGNLGYVVVSIMGGWLAAKKSIEVGDILSFIQYVRSFMQPIGQTAQIASTLQSTVAAAERVFEFLEVEEEKEEGKEELPLKKLKGEVSFKDVNFGYDPEKIIINNFSVDIKPGQRVAIVGPTGAGKTTIVKLLMRFYELNGGSIFIDGHDISEVNRKDLREALGMVLQDTWLFNGSIMENIRYGHTDASDEEVFEAAKAAYVDYFVRTLPDGYNMVLNEEADNISQGQKQLLTIARAILADPRILILDEATSSVDTRTEVLIQEAMERLMKDRTSFIIAHRLSTIRNADLILVMKDGDIVEQGKHDQLLNKKGFYASLYNSQFENE